MIWTVSGHNTQAFFCLFLTRKKSFLSCSYKNNCVATLYRDSGCDFRSLEREKKETRNRRQHRSTAKGKKGKDRAINLRLFPRVHFWGQGKCAVSPSGSEGERTRRPYFCPDMANRFYTAQSSKIHNVSLFRSELRSKKPFIRALFPFSLWNCSNKRNQISLSALPCSVQGPFIIV